jgi:hypothetical protein
MNEPILDVLRRLREEMQVQSAPEALEAKLASAFREHHAGRRLANRRWIWASAAVAASLLLVIGRWFSPATLSQAPSTPERVAIAPKVVETETMKAASVTPKTTRVRNRRKPPHVQASAKPRPQEKEFIRIPYAPALDPYDSGQVIRVSMPGASVRRLGLPVVVDRVQADVLLGDDGVARAIRLVSNSGLNSSR